MRLSAKMIADTIADTSLLGVQVVWEEARGSTPAASPRPWPAIDEDQKAIRRIVFLRKGTEVAPNATLTFADDRKIDGPYSAPDQPGTVAGPFEPVAFACATSKALTADCATRC
jgi:hypothetical protein